MEFMRKLSRSISSASQSPQSSSSLGLLTLRRQFRDVCFSMSPYTQSEQQEKLYTVLPLFLKVFKNLPPSDMKEKFGDVLQFSTRVSNLMVTEIRKRASNKSTEQASVDIANFLAPSNDNTNRGWVLLNCLSLLAAGDPSIIDCMTATHLPSTLVKCLYLFFDLPTHEADPAYTVSDEEKDMLQKVFVQTLVRLCSYISPAEELSRKDDLALLFSAVTSWCSPHNKNWRTAASDVLITISRHGLSHNVVEYIRNKNKHCIKTCINNLWRATVSVEEDSPSTVLLDVDLAEQLLCVLRFVNNSSEVTQLLLDDFRHHQGYIFIAEFVLRLETASSESERHRKALLSVIGAVENLTTCGFNELTAKYVSRQSFQDNFLVPVPLGKGESVRNIHAFQLLETLFIRSRTTFLARAVLDAVFNVYCRDPSNYFILLDLNTMSSFSERLSLKDPEIYPQYFAIFEYISLTLGYIPSKELLSISLLLKTDSNLECSIACLNSLQKLLSTSSSSYRDVFREVGLLEMLVKCLQRYSSLLKAVEVNANEETKVEDIKENHHNFGRLTMDVLVEMIQSSTNAGIFREIGGARCAFNTLSYPECRHSALSLVEQLILEPVSKNNDDDMTTLLGLLSTLSLNDIVLKIDILKTLHKVVSQSDKISLMFRNVGGFINLISIVVGMEGYISLDPSSFWKEHSQDGYVLLETVFRILAAVLKHSSNERYFEIEIGHEAFLGALQGLGCFSLESVLNEEVKKLTLENLPKHSFLQCRLQDQNFPSNEADNEIVLLQKILCLFKLLFMCGCDLFKDELQTIIENLQHSVSQYSTLSEESPRSHHDYTQGYIVHPNFFKLFIQLIPRLFVENLDFKVLVPLQLYLMEEFYWVLRNERNEQIVCESGLQSTLLTSFEDILIRDEQPLNLTCQKTLESLATQSISPQELRKLLRVGKPLHCDNLLVSNGVVALNRVKSLVSVATPRNIGMISDISSSYKPPPAFIEFDMSVEDCCHLFIPNIVPQSTASSSTSGTSLASGERLFPPAHGIAVSAWIYVENFCRQQAHPIRILTLERQVVSTRQSYVCLSVMISARRRRLIISTHEYVKNITGLATEQGEPEDSKETVGFNVDHICVEGQWHHVQVVVQRSTVLKHSTVTACFNGTVLGASKIRYFSTSPGGSSQQALNSPIAVHGWAGTSPEFSGQSTLVWRLASLRLFDETSSFVPNSSAIQTSLGPEYVGNYQNTILPDGSTGPVFAEEHLCFSLLPSSVQKVTSLFLQRSKMNLDLKMLANKINLVTQDNVTLLDFFPNACFNTPGPSRSFGGFAIGRKYKDAPRCFIPKGVGRVLQDVGGISVSLYLVAMASDVEGLYAAVKFLVCVLKSDVRAILEMERTNGYQALGMLLKEKKNLLNSHILHLTFSIAGTVDPGQGTAASVTNHSAFENLLCDLEIWHNSPQELHKSLFDHFYELLTESSDTKATHSVITGFNFVQKCVYFMYSDSTLSYTTIVTILKVIQAIFGIETKKEDILSFGQFAVSLIASSNISERNVELCEISADFAENQTKGKIDQNFRSKRTIHLRNIVLELILKCITVSSKEDTTFCEVLENCLGFDWVLLFMQSHLHFTTVTTALRLLFTILQCSYTTSSSNMPTHLAATALQAPALPGYSAPLSLIDRFRSGENFGGWLQGTDVMLEKKEDCLLGFNVRSINDFTAERYHHSVLLDAVPVPGFLALQHLMSFHASSQPVLCLLLQYFVGQYDDEPAITEYSPIEIHKFFGTYQSKLNDNTKLLSLEICQLINAMLRQLLHQDWRNSERSSWIQSDPLTLVGSFQYIYLNEISSLSYLFGTAEFLTSFLLALFPPETIVQLLSVSSPRDLLSLEELLPSGGSMESKLSSHPCVKPLYAFMCKILWDSVTAQKNKSSQMIDIILEIPMDKNSSSCLSEFVTDVILQVIDYRVANLAELIKSSHCSTSVSYLISRIVDKVWQGFYTDDCKKIFHFIAEFISNHQQKLSAAVLTNIYRSLYRLILYQLSRKHSSISEQMNVLDALHLLTTRRNIVFDGKFREVLHISSLCHCLFMVSGNSGGKDFGLEAEQSQTTWHVTEASKQPLLTSDTQVDNFWVPATPQEKGQVLLYNAAARVWSVLMATKKDVLNDTFKVALVDLGSEQGNLDSAREQIRESASKAWGNFLMQEKKLTIAGAKESPTQQKLVKRMSYLVSSRKPKKDFVSKLGKNISIQDSHLWTLNHISVVQSLVRLQYNEHEQEENHLKRFTAKEWNRNVAELTRERAVWGPEEEETLTKWTLDSTEGPCRMRKRMMKDETFYLRYPHRIKSDSTTSKHKKPTSKDSVEYHKRISCLSPYYNPESDDDEKSQPNSPVHTSNENKTVTKSNSQDIESSSDELDNDEAVILNLCLKCQPSQPSNAMKVNTLSGKEAVSCDICGLTLSSTLKDDEQESSIDSKSENIAEPAEVVRTEAKSPSETVGTVGKPSESLGTPKKHPNGIVTSESVSSLSEPSLQEKDKQDNRTILKLLEKGEKIRHMFRVARVQGLDVHEGLLLFGQDHYYIIDGFTMLKSKEIRDISSLPGEHEPIIPSSTRHKEDNLKNENVFSDRMCSKFAYSDLSEVHKRRYLLQNISLEVFNKDGRNCLLVFPQGTPSKVFNKFSSYLSDRGKDSISGQRTGLSVEQQAPVLFGLNSLFGEKTVTSRWERGEISNFQYLMYLNTLAGRSYNDLMQYPIFPWIIADYDSETLDLTKPETFRDLSKPMGSQTPSRLEQYKKRYKDWEELGGIDTPPYHYGTHYSSAMIVASYLVRMEPFTQHFLRLQGGHFDLADRMFHSIKDSWVSASQKNMADVKELIPEFFYLPEFLLNTNRFDLGQKQNGVHLDDVILPPWAKGSQHEFIRAHREALECDYVSSHLHEWIDLIFGYKQKGEAALESYNVFHHLFYEGEVDIYSIKDPLKRNATIGFINNFGQIPKQLFKRPHPQKKVKSDASSNASSEQKFYKHVESLTTSNPIKELSAPVGEIVVQDRGIIAMEKGKLLIPPNNTRYVTFGHKDLTVRVGLQESDKALQIYENLGCDEITCAAMATEDLLITGNKSTVVHVWRMPNTKDKNKSLELVKCLYGHTKPVTSIAVCTPYGIIVSGAEDGSCVLWDLNHLAFVRQLQHHNDAPISNISINENTGVIVTCSGANLYQWSINGQLIACASALSSNVRNQRITAIAMTKLNEWDPEAVVISGHSDGHLRFWRLEYVQIPESADLQVYANFGTKKPSVNLINTCKTPDTVSLTSVGELVELPWNDVSKVELSNQEQSREGTTTNQEAQPSNNKPINMKWKQQLVLKGKIELPPYKNKSTGSYTPSVTSIAISKLFSVDESVLQRKCDITDPQLVWQPRRKVAIFTPLKGWAPDTPSPHRWSPLKGITKSCMSVTKKEEFFHGFAASMCIVQLISIICAIFKASSAPFGWFGPVLAGSD